MHLLIAYGSKRGGTAGLAAGRLAADAKGFPASAMANTRAGDWRDPAHVHRWAPSVVNALVHHSEVS